MPDDAAALAALVLDQVSVLLRKLDVRQVRDLATGRAVLVVTDAVGAAAAETDTARRIQPVSRQPVSRQRASSAPPSDTSTVRSALLAMSSRGEASEYVSTFGSIPKLRALGAELGVRTLSKDPRDEVIRKIVDGTVGVRLTSDAMGGT